MKINFDLFKSYGVRDVSCVCVRDRYLEHFFPSIDPFNHIVWHVEHFSLVRSEQLHRGTFISHNRHSERRAEPFLWTLFNFLLDVCMKYAVDLSPAAVVATAMQAHILAATLAKILTLIFNMLMKVS
jgi:hypothetical protein